MRNMCGHAEPVLNGLLALDHLIGFTDIMVIHHTGMCVSPSIIHPYCKTLIRISYLLTHLDCGSLAFTDEQVRDTLRARQPDDESIDKRDFGTITE